MEKNNLHYKIELYYVIKNILLNYKEIHDDYICYLCDFENRHKRYIPKYYNKFKDIINIMKCLKELSDCYGDIYSMEKDSIRCCIFREYIRINIYKIDVSIDITYNIDFGHEYSHKDKYEFDSFHIYNSADKKKFSKRKIYNLDIDIYNINTLIIILSTQHELNPKNILPPEIYNLIYQNFIC